MTLNQRERVWGWAVLYRFVLRQYYIWGQQGQLSRQHFLFPRYLRRLRPDSETSSYASTGADSDPEDPFLGRGALEEGGGASCAEDEPAGRLEEGGGAGCADDEPEPRSA